MTGAGPGRHHAARARRELDAAYLAAGSRAAAVHLRLSLLHLAEARRLTGAEGVAEPERAEIDWLERVQPLHRRILASA